jgi:hypothetical protein
VHGIIGFWVSGDNLTEFLINISDHMPRTTSATNTWTGRIANKLGYTRVKEIDTTRMEIPATIFHFTK